MNNRLVTNMVLICCMMICLMVSQAGCGRREDQPMSRMTYALSTEITISIYDSKDQNLINKCFELCGEYDRLLSRTNEESEIARLNRLGSCEVSDETLEIIQKGLYYSQLSGGAFDITIEPVSSLWDFMAENPEVPDSTEIQNNLDKIDYSKVEIEGNRVTLQEGMGIDLGGIAKGYIADRLKDYLLSQDVKSAIINLGGNVLCIGKKSDNADFTIGIQNPQKPASIKGTVQVNDRSVVTSGTYQRTFTVDGVSYHHILDPKTGYPYDNGISSVTIICDESVDGDGLSTTCFALGIEEGCKLVESMDQVYAMFIDNQGNEIFSRGFEEAAGYRKYQ
ncbi:MAG: FAD:protein FMN transferase [Lachnospiraceae bacterium]